MARRHWRWGGHQRWQQSDAHSQPNLELGSSQKSNYVSRHVQSQISSDVVFQYVESRLGPETVMSSWRKTWRRNDDRIEIRHCPTASFCSEASKFERRLARGNEYKFIVWSEGGTYYCHRCQCKGSWYDLRFKWSGATEAKAIEWHKSYDPDPSDEVAVVQQVQLPNQAELSACVALLLTKVGEPVRQYLEARGLSVAVAAQYGVGCATRDFYDDSAQRWRKHRCVTFPWIDDMVQPPRTVRIKVRSIEEKRCMRLEPKKGGWGLFGLHVVPSDATEVVLTEGEFDAIAVRQATGRDAVSLPNGASSLPTSVLPLLERFSRIYIWMDNDASGQVGAQKFANKLGPRRCMFVRPPRSWGDEPPKDANDALRAGFDLEDAFTTASPPTHENLTRFSDLREELLHELRHPEIYRGLALQSLPGLTDMLEGARPGEFTLVTGPTGAGKTTLASQVTIDVVRQGPPALWGSFEVRNVQLATKMLRQFSSVHSPALEDMTRDQLESLCDDFERLPLHFMRFHGATKVDDVIDAMSFARYVYDVEHIVLDNLQFMVAANYESRFEAQDIAIAKFRQFATKENVHVILVVHPRKEDPTHPLTVMSIFGGAKASQEADNVIILQAPLPTNKLKESRQDSPVKSLEVHKNRFIGKTGTVRVIYEEKRRRYREVAAAVSFSGAPLTASRSSSQS